MEPPNPPAHAVQFPRRSRAARPLFIALIAILLGLITSIALPITFALSADPPDVPPTVLRSFIAHGQPWSIFESSRFGARRSMWSKLNFESMFTPRDLRSQYPDGPPPATDSAAAISTFRRIYTPHVRERPGSRAYESPAFWGQFAGASAAPEPGLLGSDYGFGWPWTALWYQVVGQDRNMTVVGADLSGGLLISGEPATVGPPRCRIIPYRPAWPGLIGNTIFFAALWSLLLVGAPALRRARRRRRGLCPRCAYDLRATPAGSLCPECGTSRAAPRNPQPL